MAWFRTAQGTRRSTRATSARLGRRGAEKAQTRPHLRNEARHRLREECSWGRRSPRAHALKGVAPVMLAGTR